MTDRPETSTVRSALLVVGAVDDLLRPGREGALIAPAEVVEAVTVIAEAVRDLRPHQVADVVEHLRAQHPEQEALGEWIQGEALDFDPEEEPVERADPEDVARARARVDEAIGAVDG